MSIWGTVADWFVVAGTLILAAVAVFQQTIRGWFYRPRLIVSCKTEPPDCVAVAFTNTQTGQFIANSVYLRLWVQNSGNATARNVEVFALELRRKRQDERWERVSTFPPMNLRWANLHLMYFPRIAPQMGKHCDLGHVVDPTRRKLLGADAPQLGLTESQTSLTFDLIAAPNHKGHIISAGQYELDVHVAAENAPPIKRTMAISLQGAWFEDEAKMLRDGVGVKII